MKTISRYIYSICILAAILFTGCAKTDIADPKFGNGGVNVPEGYAMLDIKLTPATGKVYTSRANANPLLDFIDDVHLFLFEDANDEGLNDDTPLTLRNYYQYGAQQNIFLKKGKKYYIYVVANLDDSNCPNGNVATYFDDVQKYGDLKDKYVQFLVRTPDQLGKVIMATPEIVPITLPDIPGIDDIFTPYIPLRRLQTEFIINIYNRVDPDDGNKVSSGVNPFMLSMVDMPRYSYVMERTGIETDGTHDYPFTLGDVSKGYYETSVDFLPDVEEIIEHPYNPGRFYTKQTVKFFSFENRRGSVPEILTYEDPERGVVDPVYGRRALAPEFSTHLQLMSLTPGNSLITYVHAGQGRSPENTTPPRNDDITNFDVERSCVYHFNIYINSTTDVEIDTRREYLNQAILFTLPPDIDRVDAHYVDVPSYILGTIPGFAKLQAATCYVNDNDEIEYEDGSHEPKGLIYMSEDDPDEKRWLRFSWRDPYRPAVSQPANTSLYVEMREVDGLTGATPIIHFNENLDDINKASVPGNPSKRTAVIRVGFVQHAESEEDYELGVAEGREADFFVRVDQHGLKTIGQFGGYVDGHYTSLLGIESVEEYRLRFYTREGENNLMDYINKGPYWRYMPGSINYNQTYDGKLATTDHYNEYRNLFSNGIPPRRKQNNLDGTEYNPMSNTNAVDYCMRKNRDEDGNGIIEGDEIKWYLPTPAQMMMLYTWKEAFDYGLNKDYRPFGGTSETQYYWTTNEDVTNSDNAYALDFHDKAALVTSQAKSSRFPVRCVRDIPGVDKEMFYYSKDGHLVADLEGSLPDLVDNKTNLADNDLRRPVNNTIAKSFIISRWYITSNTNNHSGNILFVDQKDQCNSSYQEDGYPTGRWHLPSQREMTLIYGNAGIIENIFEEQFGPVYNTPETYHKFIMTAPALHWAGINVDHNDQYWYVNFITGAATTMPKQNSAYHRCVHYTNNPPERQ